MRLFIFALSIATIAACQPSSGSSSADEQTPAYTIPSHHTEQLSKLLDAHGGYEQWSKMNTLSYSKGDESTITNLQNRKIRLETDKKVIGFDGNEVWVAPASVDASKARFYHNLYFYFYAMPFVVGDPGAYYEAVDSMNIKGKSYNGIKISYLDGVGDASDDNYILWTDPETNQMEWLMYTVTYRSGEPSENYRLINYEDWGSFNGLILPTKMQWYHFDGDSIGGKRGDAMIFENVIIDKTYPPDSLFVKPENAIVAPR